MQSKPFIEWVDLKQVIAINLNVLGVIMPYEMTI